MTARAWPAGVVPVGVKFRLGTSSVVITGQRNQFSPQVIKLPVQGWAAELTFRVNPLAKRLLQAHLAALDGPAGATTLPDWDYDAEGPRGTASGSITATGTKDGEQVTLHGAGTLLAGDRIGVGGWVYAVTDDVTLSGGGVVATVRPQLRADCSAAAVSLTGLLFGMRCVGDNVNELELDAAGNGDATVQLVEDLTAL